MPENENLTEIQKEFAESWEKMYRFFASSIIVHEQYYLRPIFLLIAYSKQIDGICYKLRAGQSLETFVVSRSQHWGLRKGQASLAITLQETGEAKLHYSDSTMRREATVKPLITLGYNFKIADELQHFLDLLLQHPID